MLGPGTLVSSKYRIERLLGEGGMGVVFEATHVELDGRVALKFLKPEALARPDIVARFAQEARSAVRLKSEHVARVNDVGTHDGLPYLVMELLEGKNLEEVLAETGPMPVARAADHLIDACEGISEAHARGIIHRDIKPANLFLVENEGLPTIKVLDFGISKAALTGKVTDADIKSSATTSIMGSPHYMSPEQVRSTRDVDLRTDVWSLGIVLFELLTARTPYDGKTEFTELVAAILEDPPEGLRTIRPEIPPELEAVVARCLEKDKSKRFQTAAELALALLPFTQNKRAGVVASRAVAVVKRAGLAPDLVVPSTLPPPAPSDPNSGVGSLSSGRISIAGVPAIDQLGKTAVTTESPEAILAMAKASRTPLTAGTTLVGAGNAKKRGALPFVVGGGVVVAALLAGFVALRPKAESPAAASTKPAVTAEPPAASAPLPPGTVAAAPAAPPTVDASPSAETPKPETGARTAAQPVAAPRTPKPVAAPVKKPEPGRASGGDLDIRRER